MINKYKFTKMHAFGNDFAIFDFRNENTNVIFNESQIIILTDRNFGIGCDQLLVLYKSNEPDNEKGTNVLLKVYNQDGTEAQNCGNGVRCVVGYISRESSKPLVRVNVGGRWEIGRADTKTFFARVNMGTPIVNGNIVDVGNKHKIEIVNNFDNIQKKPDPDYNVHYVKINSKDEVFMRTIERGTGETLCCGSGTCAVVAYCVTNNLTNRKVRVISRGSDIMEAAAEVSWEEGKPIILGGNYSFVFTGEVEI